MINIRSYYKKDGIRPALSFDNPTLTEQHHRESCDVNYIIDVFQRTGKISPGNSCFYEDVSDRPSDLLECMNVVKRSQEIFSSIPSKIRARFDNDPVKLLDWISDPSNRKEAGEIGLLSKITEAESLQASQSAHQPDLMLNVPTDTTNN